MPNTAAACIIHEHTAHEGIILLSLRSAAEIPYRLSSRSRTPPHQSPCAVWILIWYHTRPTDNRLPLPNSELECTQLSFPRSRGPLCVLGPHSTWNSWTFSAQLTSYMMGVEFELKNINWISQKLVYNNVKFILQNNKKIKCNIFRTKF